MSAILKQLEEYKAAAEISAEFLDLVSVEQLADMTKKSVVQVKAICKSLGIEPKNRFGKSYFYSKRDWLVATVTDGSTKLHPAPKQNKQAV